MDWVATKERVIEYLKKYRHILLVLLAGMLLMAWPEAEEPETRQEAAILETSPGLQDSLAAILSHISGAGEVKVLLTQAAGEETIYQMDEDMSAEDIRRDTVLISNADSEDEGLIKQINPPIYQGAIVLCQGADDANVRLSIVKAVMSVTGLTSDHITVLKMK